MEFSMSVLQFGNVTLPQHTQQLHTLEPHKLQLTRECISEAHRMFWYKWP